MSQKKIKPLSKVEKEKVEQFVQNHIEHISNCGSLRHFRCEDIEWIDKDSSHMEIDVNDRYVYFRLYLSEKHVTKYWRRKEYEYLISALCHELCHIIAGESARNLKFKSKPSEVGYYEERATEFFSRYLVSLYHDYMKVHNVDIKTGLIIKKKK